MVKRPATVGRDGTRPVFLAGGVLIVALALSFFATHTPSTSTQKLAADLTEPILKNNNPTTLAACSGSEILFPKQRTNTLQAWSKQYDKTMRTVVSDLAAANENPQCTLSRSEDIPASLRGMAMSLSPWKNPKTLDALRREDAGSVLLEYVRVYECAMNEYAWELAPNVAQEVRNTIGDNAKSPPPGFIALSDLNKDILAQLSMIARETATARPTLQRVMTFLANSTRLSPISENMECLARASADLRNVLGLAAETSACLPRIWDARGALVNSTMTSTSDK